MDMHLVLPVIAAGASVATAILSVLSKRSDDDDEQDAYWDPDCACCTAGCGETDDDNRCVICTH